MNKDLSAAHELLMKIFLDPCADRDQSNRLYTSDLGRVQQLNTAQHVVR
jgi:hypothetical protein